MIESKTKPQILLTNDDGIDSPGLWAAAAELEKLGYVYVIAPREQHSGAGRSLPTSSDGIIETKFVEVNNKTWEVHAVGSSPAQAVLHGVLEVMPLRPDLVVSGINYGSNIGSGITISGTVGAALEASSLGIPSLAVSLETENKYHLSHSGDIDFTVAGHFTHKFAKLLLSQALHDDIDVLKLEIPANATLETPWHITRLWKERFYDPTAPERTSWDQPGRVGYKDRYNRHHAPKDTDVYTIKIAGEVSVTPLSLDMTSRVDLEELKHLITQHLNE